MVPSLVVSLFLCFVIWVVARRTRRPKSPLAEVPGPESDHWLKGNFGRIFQDGWYYNLQLAEKYGGVVKVHALLGAEQLYVSDPLALHYVVVKEQHIYTETDMFIMANKLIFGDGLISTLGEQHKKQRKMLNPVFSLANMRDLLPIIQPIADKLSGIFLEQIPDGDSKEINVLPWMSRGALEYICQAALGYSFNVLDPTRTSAYAEAIQKLAPSGLRLIFIRPFVPLFLCTIKSPSLRNQFAERFPLKAFQDMRSVVEALDKGSRRIFREKKTRMLNSGELRASWVEVEGSKRSGVPVQGKEEGERDLGDRMRGRDIMSIMLRANMSSEESERLSDEELLGQMSTIIFAGFETTSTAISRILYILASKPEVQAKLRSEIRKAKQRYANTQAGWEEVGIGYDELMAIPYLDAVVRETLRVYPPTSLLSRTCRQDTTLPLAYPITSSSGVTLTSVAVPAGTSVIMSLLAANHNKQVWGPDADEWRPERWLTESGERVMFSEGDGEEDGEGRVKYPGVYASMMTFLGGGRACIGFKFAEMEIKQVITTFLSRMHFSLPYETDSHGNKKSITWKMNGLQVPVVDPPFGDGVTAQVPLIVRRVKQEDFVA
ncbi:cytochrome P450 [Neolentinus lepideus HHB14362 ss-1]|uniref:Cytochrome P450 n=1 Tax=Neolentinus lepideus HHB14362 ss-1 TaxID=1314782 RepID=A0A165RSP9_9AGAM|nr:cytochrome P450 [Neolentinus lepideus HHB14362 ss-1]